MNISFFQILILLIVVFVLFGDFNKIQTFCKKINAFFKNKQKK